MKYLSAGRGRSLALALAFCLLLTALLPLSARAREAAAPAGRVVRVGWYESPYNTMDAAGRRSGYAYEYQRKLAAYTGWTYEYVEGSWPELLQMLEAGEIDLLSDVSYTEDRAQRLLYSALPMGTEEYYVFVAPENAETVRNDFTALNGKRVGADRGSVQLDFFLEWERKHGVEAEVVELTGSLEASLQMLAAGELDAYVTLDTNGSIGSVASVCKVGASEFYFAVRPDRADLLAELDLAMSRIFDENKYFNQKMMEKHLGDSEGSRYLRQEELDWLAGHGTIRVGYQDGYLAFCAADETGALTGALKDYLELAATGMANAELDFEAVAYPTAAAAVEALLAGEVDCMFPANLTDYDGEVLGLVMSPALMRTEMEAVIRTSDQKDFFYRDRVTVAVNAGNPNYEMFLADHFSGWEVVHFADTAACLKGVAAGEADCILISSYRFRNIAKQCEELNLTTVSTGVDLDYCFALRAGETALYGILAKTTAAVPDSAVHAALTYYSAEDAKLGFLDVVKQNLPTVLSIIGPVVLLFVFLLLLDIRAQRKALAERSKAALLRRQVYADPLTAAGNRRAFNDLMENLQERLDLEPRLEFAVGVFDCDDLKRVNDQYGHEEGDAYLTAACRLISQVFTRSPLFRIGGDEFALVLQEGDFRDREALTARFRAAEAAPADPQAPWERVRVSMGLAAYDPLRDASPNDTVRRADRMMYENKRRRKESVRN